MSQQCFDIIEKNNGNLLYNDNSEKFILSKI